MNSAEYSTHPAWSLINQAKDSLENLNKSFPDDVLVEDVKSKISFIEWIFEQSDPALITHNEMQKTQSALQNIVNVVFQSQSSVSNLTSLDPYYNQIVSVFPYPRIQKIFRSEQNEIITDFRDRVRSLREELEKAQIQAASEKEARISEMAALDADFKRLQEKLDQNDARVNSQFENWETRYNTEISERLGEVEGRFAKSQTERDDAFSNLRKQFDEQVAEAKANLQAQRDRIELFLSEQTREIEEWNNLFEAQSVETLNKIRKIYNIAGQTALAGDFENAAKEETKLANVFSVLAGLFVILAPFALMYQWSQYDIETPQSIGFALKITSVLAFFVPAAFFGANAQRHRRVAVALRSLGIRVATFDAYLVNFEEAERNSLKEKMANIFFANNITPDRVASASKRDLDKVMDISTKLFDRVEQLVDKSTS